jgi:hypothetical protein
MAWGSRAGGMVGAFRLASIRQPSTWDRSILAPRPASVPNCLPEESRTLRRVVRPRPQNIRSRILAGTPPCRLVIASRDEVLQWCVEGEAGDGSRLLSMPKRAHRHTFRRRLQPRFLRVSGSFVPSPAPCQSPMLPFWQGLPLSAVTAGFLGHGTHPTGLSTGRTSIHRACQPGRA